MKKKIKRSSNKRMSVFRIQEYKRCLRYKPFEIISILWDDLFCCMERARKGYCYRDLDNMDIWCLRIIPDMLSGFIEKNMKIPGHIYEKYKDQKDGIEKAEDEWKEILKNIIFLFEEANEDVNVNIKMLKKWKIKMYIFQELFLSLCFHKGSFFFQTV